MRGKTNTKNREECSSSSSSSTCDGGMPYAPAPVKRKRTTLGAHPGVASRGTASNSASFSSKPASRAASSSLPSKEAHSPSLSELGRFEEGQES